MTLLRQSEEEMRTDRLFVTAERQSRELGKENQRERAGWISQKEYD